MLSVRRFYRLNLLPQLIFRIRPCHPGPCPPCLLSIERKCHCGKETLTLRCSRAHDSSAVSSLVLSCGRECGKLLGCGNHHCRDMCHAGSCQPCSQLEKILCFCGKDEMEAECGFRSSDTMLCSKIHNPNNLTAGLQTVEEWEGRYQCGNNCGRLFSCGVHVCQKVRCSLTRRNFLILIRLCILVMSPSSSL